MKQADYQVCRKMIQYCDQITEMTERFGNSLDAYKGDTVFQLAAGMCILQIGELVNRLSAEALEENVQIPWRMIRAMRNVYAHDYDRTKPLTVWQTITEDIPAFRSQLQAILDNGHEDMRS